MGFEPTDRGFPDRRFSKPLLSASQPTIHELVGVTGFEPAPSWSQTTRSTRLSYTPKCRNVAYGGPFLFRRPPPDGRAYFRLRWFGNLRIRGGAYCRIGAGISSPRRLLRDLTTPPEEEASVSAIAKTWLATPGLILLIGPPGGIQTHNPRLRRSLLYSVELQADDWYVLRGSNPRHSVCRTDALPAELRTRNGGVGTDSNLRVPKESGLQPDGFDHSPTTP